MRQPLGSLTRPCSICEGIKPCAFTFAVVVKPSFLTTPISDYEQLGLKFRLYSAEVLFNRGLCMVNMGEMEKGLQMMQEARREKATEEHNVIDEALVDQGQGYTVFSIVSTPPCQKRKTLYSDSISPSVYSTVHRRRNSRMQCKRTTWERP